MLALQSCLEVGFEDLYPSGDLIDFPKRPPWSQSDSKEDLEQREQAYFQSWLESIYSRFDPAELSYFEHNLEVWRQLWRVVEASDIILFVVDARHPILHFPPTLYDYIVNELGKKLVLVFNKIDLVPHSIIHEWEIYFKNRFPDLLTASFSCYPKQQQKARKPRRTKRYAYADGVLQVIQACRDVHLVKSGVVVDWDAIIDKLESEINHRKELDAARLARKQDPETFLGRSRRRQRLPPQNDSHNTGSIDNDADRDQENDDNHGTLGQNTDDLNDSQSDHTSDGEGSEPDSSRIQSTAEDLQADPHYHIAPHSDLVTIGLVGHPNVGKSSLINGIMGHKVVSTSRTPGHTKHFQTIHLTADVRLCDCPGLVFPSKLVKPLQILSGMYRIAQVQEPYSVVTFLAQRIPLPQLLNLSPPPDDMSQLSDTQPRRTQKASNKQQTQDRNAYQWSGWTICESLAILKGFLTPKA
eukprot:jgi/Hompol1/3129/HPOL_006365-RA